MSVFKNIYTDGLEKYNVVKEFDNLHREFQLVDIYLTALCSSFKWQNCPKGNIPFTNEPRLQLSGRLAVFKDDSGNVQIHPCYPSGYLLPNGEYERYTIIARNGDQWIRKYDEIAIIFNNSFKLPYYSLVTQLADKSTKALIAVDAALERAATPPVLECDTDEALKTAIEVLGADKNRAFFVKKKQGGYGESSMTRVSSFDNRETDILSLWDVFSRYDRFFYRTFGISTVGIQKNERLTKAESTGEEEMTRYSLFEDMWERRKEGIEQANEMFGTEISIEINRDSKTVYEMNLDNDEKIEMERIEATKGANITPEGVVKTDEQEVENDG